MDKSSQICPVCKKPWEFALRITSDGSCEHDNGSIGTVSEMEAKRRYNRQATAEAMNKASAMRAEHNKADPMVNLRNLTGQGASREASVGPINVRTSTLKKLAEKAHDAGYE